MVRQLGGLLPPRLSAGVLVLTLTAFAIVGGRDLGRVIDLSRAADEAQLASLSRAQLFERILGKNVAIQQAIESHVGDGAVVAYVCETLPPGYRALRNLVYPVQLQPRVGRKMIPAPEVLAAVRGSSDIFMLDHAPHFGVPWATWCVKLAGTDEWSLWRMKDAAR